ncbi:hypothetical protein M885DRAFT_546039 [Pelagophyceae sp. CCMP2097]|nr:hypothetical protein M885DRAFT_546039 [Pelagophyceae sp. CCMP2097]
MACACPQRQTQKPPFPADSPGLGGSPSVEGGTQVQNGSDPQPRLPPPPAEGKGDHTPVTLPLPGTSAVTADHDTASGEQPLWQ